MRRYQIDIEGRAFSATTASAEEQFEALHIAGRTSLIGTIRESAKPEAVMVVMLGLLSMDDLNRLIALLVTDKVLTAGDNIPVAVNLFQDQVEQFYLLLAIAVLENLQGFSKLRSQLESGDPAAEQRKS